MDLPQNNIKAIKLISKDTNFFLNLITERFSLDNIKSAFDIASKGENIKIMIKP